jgi:tetratricopeptide (TPR) repeat protein
VNARSTLIALLLAAGTAYANPAADAALSEGRRLYDLQEWDQAIVKFKEAYRLRADAPSLFNIAQSYRLKGDCANAASFYKTFKRNFPKEKNIDKVDKFISEMETCAKSGIKPVEPVKTEPVKTDPVKTEPVKTEPVTTEPVTTEPVTTEPVTTDPSGGSISQPMPPPQKGGGGMKIAGLGVAGVGVIGLGVGVMFGVKARSAASDAEAIEMGQPWRPEIEDRGEKASKNAKLFLIIGSAAVVTGGVLYFLGAKKSKESSSVTFVPTEDGASFAWTRGF